MAKVEVVATQMGYYKHARRNEGVVFFMDEKDMKKDEKGKMILPRWVELKSKVKAKPKPIDPALSEESDDVI